MTNEEREALIAQGWTPPVAVDPDWKHADLVYELHDDHNKTLVDLAFAGIKRGRALAAAEAKPGVVWKKWDGSTTRPSDVHCYVWIKNRQGTSIYHTNDVAWSTVTHYAIITPPAEDK